jgi:hypothetical protein
MNMKNLILLLIISMVSLKADEKPVLSFFPDFKEIELHSTVTLEIRLDNVQSLKGYSITLSYNQEKIRIDKIREGTLFTSPVYFAPLIDSIAGKITVESALLGSGRMANGSGVLFYADIVGVSEGVDTLIFSGVNLRDSELARLDFGVRNGLIFIGQPSGLDIYEYPIVSYMVYQNYPNPFNPETNIYFHLPYESKVTIRVFNTEGRQVLTPVSSAIYRQGYHSITLDLIGLASGVYFYQFSASSLDVQKTFQDTKSMIYLQ